MRVKWLIGLGGFIAATLATLPARAQCDAPATWVSHATIPKPTVADPGIDHCKFHQWSWQTFLWLTQKVNGELRFIKEMYSNDNLFSLQQFGSPLPDWTRLAKGGPLTLRPRDNKPLKIRGIGEINEAGDNGILVDQHNHAVYYAIHINQDYYDFIVKRKYYDPQTLLNASAVDNFPSGTLAIKSSWRIVNTGEDTSRDYTTSADLQPLVASHGTVVVNPRKPAASPLTKVALVGMHVAGVIDGHPEFIWATFERQGNAPQLPDGMLMSAADAVSNSNARFYAANTAAKDSNVTNNGQVTVIDPCEQTIQPISHVVREVAWGGAEDVDLVKSLNRSVQSLLATDTAANYDLIGSIWVDKGFFQPNQIPGDPDHQQGSRRLANTTMETFRQSRGNCFNCHDTRGYKDEGIDMGAKDLNVSHALRRSFIINTQFQQGKTAKNVLKAPTK